jgi:hypothetical protein
VRYTKNILSYNLSKELGTRYSHFLDLIHTYLSVGFLIGAKSEKSMVSLPRQENQGILYILYYSSSESNLLFISTGESNSTVTAGSVPRSLGVSA